MVRGVDRADGGIQKRCWIGVCPSLSKPLRTKTYGGRGQKFGFFLAIEHSVNSKAFIRLRFRSV